MGQANEISRLERAAQRAGRRLELGRALAATSACLPLPIGYAALVIGLALVALTATFGAPAAG